MPEKKLNPEGKLIGIISHYFGHIRVGVVELSGGLEEGENIRVVGGETDFEQQVESMEVDHKKMKKAKKGDSVGLKFDQKVREGYKVYKI